MKYYTIGGFDKTATVSLSGLIKNIELSWIDGQVGAMPVFDNYQKVSEYANKHNYEIIMFEAKDEQ